MDQHVVNEEDLSEHATNERIQNGSLRGPLHDGGEEQTDENIFLFIPNLIGYFRIILCLASLYFMPLHPRRCSFLYLISCLLDALDGIAARRFEQSTRFGMVLDMVADRCTTTCLLVFLATAKPAYSMISQVLISLDLASHYMHMYATLAMGGQTQSHKDVDAQSNWLMNKYYKNKAVLFVTCALNEPFFIALYLLCFSSPIITPKLKWPDEDASSPTMSLQSRPSIWSPTPYSAAAMEMARANKMDSNFPWILCILSGPVMILKQSINIVQIWEASKWLAEGDRKDRKRRDFPEGGRRTAH